MKKFIQLTITLCLSLTLFACSSKSPEDFDSFVESLPAQFMDSDDLNLEFTFEHPEDYGFEEETLNLPYSDKKDYEESEDQIKELEKELKSYDYKSLSDEQKETYDVIEDYLERHEDLSDYYYLDNSYLGSFIGYQAELPLVLYEYTFEDKNDIESYLNILEESPEYFDKYAQIEEERQAQGCGMSQEILDKVIQQCNNFAKDKDCFLIDAINEKIDACTFLDDSQKKEYKEKNEDLVKNSFQKAYKQLGTRLSKIEGSDESVGLYYSDNGKEYYEYLIQSSIGTDMSVEEIKQYFEDKMDDITDEMIEVVRRNPDAYDELMNMDLNDTVYCDFTSFEETINYLKEATSEDYPELKDLTYDVTKVPASMADNFSPAAYLTCKIDSSDDVQHIWVNGDYDQDLFTTLAHEGYPGHMYQNAYVREEQLPTIRYILDYNGYSEGWATYVENDSWQYVEDNMNEDLIHLVTLNSEYTNCIIALLDIEIHYEGMKYDEYVDEMADYGIDTDSVSEEDLKEQYLLIVETPSNYLQYFLPGFLFEDYEQEAKDALGEDFDIKEFHEVLLKNGNRSMEQVHEDVENYINANLE